MPTAGYPAVGKVYITPMKPQQLRRGKQGENNDRIIRNARQA